MELADLGRNELPEARAVEHAVVADVELQIVQLAAGGNIDAEIVRSLGLADAGNVVLLALDRHQAAAADRRQIDRRRRDASSRPSAGDGARTRVSIVCM